MQHEAKTGSAELSVQALRLADLLEQLIHDLQPLADNREPAQDSSPVLAASVMHELAEKLKAGNIEANDVAMHHASILRAELGEQSGTELLRLIAAFDFESALNILQTTKQQ